MICSLNGSGCYSHSENTWSHQKTVVLDHNTASSCGFCSRNAGGYPFHKRVGADLQPFQPASYPHDGSFVDANCLGIGSCHYYCCQAGSFERGIV